MILVRNFYLLKTDEGQLSVNKRVVLSGNNLIGAKPFFDNQLNQTTVNILLWIEQVLKNLQE